MNNENGKTHKNYVALITQQRVADEIATGNNPKICQ